jgi:hypothetical protein
MRNPFSIAALPTIFACLLLLVTTNVQAETELPSPSPEWSGIKNILSVMGQGTLSAADQKSILDILDTKSQVEEAKVTAPVSLPPKAYRPVANKKQPPHRNPSAF